MWEEMCILELMNCDVYGNVNKKLAQNSIIKIPIIVFTILPVYSILHTQNKYSVLG